MQDESHFISFKKVFRLTYGAWINRQLTRACCSFSPLIHLIINQPPRPCNYHWPHIWNAGVICKSKCIHFHFPSQFTASEGLSNPYPISIQGLSPPHFQHQDPFCQPESCQILEFHPEVLLPRTTSILIWISSTIRSWDNNLSASSVFWMQFQETPVVSGEMRQEREDSW